MRKTLILIIGLVCLFSGSLVAEEFQKIIVQPGDTLWGIANRYLKDPNRWPDIVKHNKLPTSDPTIALPGTQLKIPLLLIKDKFKKAHLVHMIPEVRVKQKNKTTWKTAQKNMVLHYEDSLRTMETGQAHVRFPSKEVVRISENSYVVVKPEKLIQEIHLIKGEVRASRAKTIMPHGTVVEPKDRKSTYHAKVRKDDTEVVFVYKGRVDVTAQGKTVTVLEGFGTEVPKKAPPLKPLPLKKFKDYDPTMKEIPAPQSKSLMSPNINMPQKTKRSKEPSTKSLISKDLLANYRVQLSNDEEFSTIALNKIKPTGEIFNIHDQKIPDGTYFMRIAFIDAKGKEGKFSEPTTVIKDTVPPTVTIKRPNEGKTYHGGTTFAEVTGVVEGATLVAVNEDVLFIDQNGRFNKLVSLSEGENLIKIIARDMNGNETVLRRKVFYKKGK